MKLRKEYSSLSLENHSSLAEALLAAKIIKRFNLVSETPITESELCLHPKLTIEFIFIYKFICLMPSKEASLSKTEMQS